MKTESGPLKYRLARKRDNSPIMDILGPEPYEYFLQGWFETREYIEADTLIGGEWRTLETVDLDKEA